MTVIDLQHGDLAARLSTKGGLLLGFSSMGPDGVAQPLLREAVDAASPLQSACFPLVPFGNRLKDNRFELDGRKFELAPNLAPDQPYIHGDGWLAEWQVVDSDPYRATLHLHHSGAAQSPYHYHAIQTVELDANGLLMSMSLVNEGKAPLPFGLGWHPYFPMTAETMLQAPLKHFWTEAAGHFPGRLASVPEDLDFSNPRRLPRRWVNNAFEGWSGHAEIAWPERRLALTIDADSLLQHVVIFVSDPLYDPTYQNDWFCFEPMSHRVGGHGTPDLGGLTLLAPGEGMKSWMRLSPHRT
jgi:aldose 1-epimerase